MIRHHEALIRTARETRAATDRATDDVTAGLIDPRGQTHERHAWMLRASLGRR